jgi:predicted permease
LARPPSSPSNRGFALTAILSLALGIGVNTVVFSLASEFLFNEPSGRNMSSFVRAQIGGRSQVGMREYRFLRDARVFPDLTGFDENAQVNWRSGESSRRLFAVRVTDNFFAVTRVPVALGRGIEAGERDTAVVSHRFWTGSLQGDPRAVGRTLTLDGHPYTVTGVMPPNHRTLIGLAFAPDLYLPVRTETARVGLYGRLPEGGTLESFTGQLESAGARLDQVYPGSEPKWATNIKVTRLTGIERFAKGNKALTSFAAFFVMLTIVVGLLLMIACANVAGLLLARAASRAREFAIRMSIGAGRGRLIRQLLAESLLLSALGAAAGLGLNLILTGVLNGISLPAPVPIVLEMRPDWRLLAYLAAIACLSAVMVGLLPALTSTRAGAGSVLKRDEHQVGSGGLLRKALVAGQLAVSVVVLLTAALFVRNLLQSVNMDPGFDLERTSWAQMRLAPETYATAEKTLTLAGAALTELRALPGVEAATLTNVVPLNDRSNSSGQVHADIRAEPIRLRYETFNVARDFFRTMAIPLIEGRDFQDSNRDGSPRVAVLNRTFARTMFGSVSPVGHTIRLGNTPITVVGVAADSKYASLGEDPSPAIFEPYLQHRGNRDTLHFLIRARGLPATLTPAIDRALLALDPSAAVETKPMKQAMGFALFPSRAGAGLLGAIGILGLTLASIGLYGVLAYSVSRRIREFGVRIAFGAQPRDVLRLVLTESAWILGIGLSIGLAASIFVTKPLAMFLVSGLSPSDPLTYFSVTALLIAVGCAASVKPALRALRADPAVALRDA